MCRRDCVHYGGRPRSCCDEYPWLHVLYQTLIKRYISGRRPYCSWRSLQWGNRQMAVKQNWVILVNSFSRYISRFPELIHPILKLVKQGNFTFNALVSDYLPQFRNSMIVDGTNTQQTSLRPTETVITLTSSHHDKRSLLSH